jgi:hypothetical protein
VEGSCEHGNEPSGSIKCWGNSCVAAQLAASQKELGSMELFFTALKLHTRIKQTQERQYYTIVHKDMEMFRKYCH